MSADAGSPGSPADPPRPEQPAPEFDHDLAAAVNEALVGELDQGLAVDPDTPFGEERRLFAALYVRHRHSLEVLARRYLKDARDVDEVVQETFLRLFLALPDLESETQAIAWCRRTATNLCIDRYRAAQRRPRMVDLGLVAHELVLDDDPTDPLVQAEDAAIVREALSLLSPLHREALVKREIEEKSLPQIAAELQIAEESVKHVLYRARRALRRLLVGTGVEPLGSRAKTAGTTLLLILTVIFGLPALQSSITGTPGGDDSLSSPAPQSGELASPGGGEPGPTGLDSGPGPTGPTGPAAPGAGGIESTEAAAEPPAAVPSGPDLALLAPPTAAAAPLPGAPIADLAAGRGGEGAAASTAVLVPTAVPPPAAKLPQEQAAEPLVDEARTLPPDLATTPVPVTDTFGRRFSIEGGGTLNGTGVVEQVSSSDLHSGQRLAVSRFVSPSLTGDLALHQNVTQEKDGRIVLDVVPILFGADGAQLDVQVLAAIREFVRLDDGTVSVRSVQRLLVGALATQVAPGPDGLVVAPLLAPALIEQTLTVEMIMTADLLTVLSEFVTLR